MKGLDDLKDRKLAYIGVPLFLIVLLGAAFTFTQGSIVPESQVERITFYHITDGAYAYDRLQDTFDDYYAGVHGDNARVGEYRIVLDPFAANAAYGNYGTHSCFAVPRVEKNGQVIDDYSLQDNPIIRYSPWVDETGTDNRNQQYGDLEALFAVALYMDNVVHYGNYYGVEQCYGPFNQYSIQVPFDEISMSSEAPVNVTEGESVEVEALFENSWKPLQADIRGESCIGGYCSEFSKSNVSIPVGGRTVTLEVGEAVENFTGEVSVDMGGTLGLDMDEFQTRNVVTDCDGDGVNENASRCSTVKIAELGGDEVVNVIPEPEEPPEAGPGIIDRVLGLVWNILSSKG